MCQKRNRKSIRNTFFRLLGFFFWRKKLIKEEKIFGGCCVLCSGFVVIWAFYTAAALSS